MYQHEVPPSLHDQKHETSCTLDQTTSNRFEVIHNCSAHTLVTESELDCGLYKLYCLGM